MDSSYTWLLSEWREVYNLSLNESKLSWTAATLGYWVSEWREVWTLKNITFVIDQSKFGHNGHENEKEITNINCCNKNKSDFVSGWVCIAWNICTYTMPLIQTCFEKNVISRPSNMYDFGVLFTLFHPFYAFAILFFICTIFDNAGFFFACHRLCKSHGRDLTQSIPVWSLFPVVQSA